MKLSYLSVGTLTSDLRALYQKLDDRALDAQNLLTRHWNDEQPVVCETIRREKRKFDEARQAAWTACTEMLRVLDLVGTEVKCAGGKAHLRHPDAPSPPPRLADYV